MAHLAAHGILTLAFGPGRVRLVPNLEVGDEDITRVLEVLHSFPAA
ncbi:MAG: hypothetical protein IPH86_03630 [bacterium]|nr:hypothetical protein [bacterium]